jgi:hypothetical protein
MKRCLLGLLVLFVVNLLSASTAPGGPSMADLKVRIVKTSPSGNIIVELSNASKESLKIWEESNSWGAARWRVLRIRKGLLETFFQNPNQIFTVNFPAVTEIAAGAHIERKLDINGGNWCGLGHCAPYNERGFGGEKISFEQDDMIIVIYDVPPTKEAGKVGAWYGVATAFTAIQ